MRLLVFSLETKGHHSGYLRHLIDGWIRSEVQGTLHVVVAPSFREKFPEIAKIRENQRKSDLSREKTTLKKKTKVFMLTNSNAHIFHHACANFWDLQKVQRAKSVIFRLLQCMFLPLWWSKNDIYFVFEKVKRF